MKHSLALLPLALAACVPAAKPPASPPPPAPTVATPPPARPPLGLDWRDWPLTPGTWSYRRYELGSSAVFLSSGAGFTIECSNDGRVRLHRPIDPSRGGGAMTVHTSSLQRSLPVGFIGHPPSELAATLSARDPLLDAMAFSRGRFTVEQTGFPTLVLPAYAEVGRVVEDCRP